MINSTKRDVHCFCEKVVDNPKVRISVENSTPIGKEGLGNKLQSLKEGSLWRRLTCIADRRYGVRLCCHVGRQVRRLEAVWDDILIIIYYPDQEACDITSHAKSCSQRAARESSSQPSRRPCNRNQTSS